MSDTATEEITAVEAVLLQKAADIIDRDGWWNGSADQQNTANPRRCIWTAVVQAIAENAVARGYPADMIRHFEHTPMIDVLCRHFKLDTRDQDRGAKQLFDLNDGRPLLSGKAWATTHLRAAAAELLEADREDGGA